MHEVHKIILVEDDESLGFLLKDSLGSNGWEVSLYNNGEKGLSAFHHSSFDLCILDIMLLHKDGFELASEIRRYDQRIPIVFLTAKNQTDDRIKGFQLGADDYVCKPFSMEEFKYRIEAILKRSSAKDTAINKSSIVHVSQSSLDIHNLTLNANGAITRLTYKESKLLELFFRHINKVVEREVFLKTVWEDDGFFVARSMDVFVSRLRKYLASDQHLKIENIRGVGYILKQSN